MLTIKPLSVTITVFNPLYLAFKSQLLGAKCLFKNQYLQILDLKLNSYFYLLEVVDRVIEKQFHLGKTYNHLFKRLKG